MDRRRRRRVYHRERHRVNRSNHTKYFLRKRINMGNMCAGTRECAYKTDTVNLKEAHAPATFGMLCKRPYEKEVVVKFERIYSAQQRRRRKKKKVSR